MSELPLEPLLDPELPEVPPLWPPPEDPELPELPEAPLDPEVFEDPAEREPPVKAPARRRTSPLGRMTRPESTGVAPVKATMRGALGSIAGAGCAEELRFIRPVSRANQGVITALSSTEFPVEGTQLFDAS